MEHDGKRHIFVLPQGARELSPLEMNGISFNAPHSPSRSGRDVAGADNKNPERRDRQMPSALKAIIGKNTVKNF